MFHPPMDSGRRLADETSPPFFRFKQAIDFCNKFLGQVSSANCHLHRSSVIKRYLKYVYKIVLYHWVLCSYAWHTSVWRICGSPGGGDGVRDLGAGLHAPRRKTSRVSRPETGV